MSTSDILMLAAIAVVGFNLAFRFETLGGLVAIYVYAMFRLTATANPWLAAAVGLGIGLSTIVPQMWFMLRFLKGKSVGLWLYLSLQPAVFLLLASLARNSHDLGVLAIPAIWWLLEYSRSEFGKLRFSWLIPGHALSAPFWSTLLGTGVYGFSFIALAGLSAMSFCTTSYGRAIVIMAAVFTMIAHEHRYQRSESLEAAGLMGEAGVEADGVTLRFLSLEEVVQKLDHCKALHPNAKLLVAPEYMLAGSPPQEVLDWCRINNRWLVIGGRHFLSDGSNFYNTAFVISPDGEMVFEQAKMVPIPTVPDGLPALTQGLCWIDDKPFGIAVCYDLQFGRVITPLVHAGAKAIIVIAMDLEGWGPHEHRLQERWARIVSRVYGVPVFRVVSSGKCQICVDGVEIITSDPTGTIAGALPLND